MGAWEVIGVIILIIGIMIVSDAIALTKEVKEVCADHGYMKNRGSIWDDYFTCYNDSIIDGIYNVTISEDFMRT